jgi:Zn-dependent peptidase ImmA (M78 family)
MPIKTRGTRHAKELLRNERAKVPVPVEKIARKYAQLFRETLPDDVSGMLVPLSTERKPRWAIVVNASDPPVRQRFTIAHELGHLLIHKYLTPHADGRYQVRFRNERSASGSVREEIEANQFAAELLMPEREVRRLAVRFRLDVLDQSRDKEAVKKLIDAAKRFQVSAQALSFRIANLGMS